MPGRLTPEDILERAREADGLARHCSLCPRHCSVQRPEGERGYCNTGFLPLLAAAVPHFGEEPPLVASGGAGALFLSKCNLKCVYCQNHQISQEGSGIQVLPDELAEKMLQLEKQGCSTLEVVSPTHHLPGLLRGLAAAIEQGLDIPFVYNTNGYETPQTLHILDGVVDVYLPDLKYASDEAAARFSDVDDYVETAREAVLTMFEQVGNLVVDIHGRAVRGLILRHLVLPGEASGTEETLRWIAENLPNTVTVSLMAQYAPLHRAGDFPPLDRPLAEEEYNAAVDLAWELGLRNVFVQDLDSRDLGIPDFSSERPFDWGK